MTMENEGVRAACAKRASPYLSPEQAAFYLGVSYRTLQRRRVAGEGPRVRRHCRHLRYHIDDLEAWSKQSGAPGNG